MSDYYLFHINVELGWDASAPLLRSLAILAEGGQPGEAETEGLPGIVRSYLMHPWSPGDGVYMFQKQEPMRLTADGGVEPDPAKAHLTRYHLRMVQTFHDDEYFNGGMYWPYWLFQFAATDGPIATRQQINGFQLPEVISKDGDRLIETQLAYAPDWLWPIGVSKAPDPETPVVVRENRQIDLPDFLEQISDFAEQQ